MVIPLVLVAMPLVARTRLVLLLPRLPLLTPVMVVAGEGEGEVAVLVLELEVREVAETWAIALFGISNDYAQHDNSPHNKSKKS
jgi:hypothetical protein